MRLCGGVVNPWTPKSGMGSHSPLLARWVQLKILCAVWLQDRDNCKLPVWPADPFPGLLIWQSRLTIAFCLFVYFPLHWYFLVAGCYRIQLETPCCLVTKSFPTLCNPMDCSPPGSSVSGFSRKEYWSGSPFPTPRDLPDPGIEPASALVGGFFTTEPPG